MRLHPQLAVIVTRNFSGLIGAVASCLVLLISVPSLAQPNPPAGFDPKINSKSLLGKWKLIKFEGDSGKIQKIDGDYFIEFKNDFVLWSPWIPINLDRATQKAKFKYTIDVEAKPVVIKFIVSYPLEKGEVEQAIDWKYSCKIEDGLLFLINDSSKPSEAPDSFDTSKGTLRKCFTYKKQGKE